MGKTKRQFTKSFTDYKKSHKKAFLAILEIMPNKYTDEVFVDSFKHYYTDLFENIKKEYIYWRKKNDKIIALGKKSRYNFPSPFKYVITSSYLIRRSRDRNRLILSDAEINEKKNILESIKEKRISKNVQNKDKKMELISEDILPTHIQHFINKYFRLKSINQDIFTEKLYIIKEVSKYKHYIVIDFLSKINAVEKNFLLKLEAVFSLQRFGEKVMLRRKPKGNKSRESQIVPDLGETPSFLSYMIDNGQLEQYKEYDIFLSHSSYDRDEVIRLAKIFNSIGLHTYTDWINDLHYLKRDLLSNETTKILIDRLNKSKILVYYITESSLDSYWTSWEIGYFMGLGKEIFIYNPDKLEVPHYIVKFYNLQIKDNLIVLENADKTIIEILESVKAK